MLMLYPHSLPHLSHSQGIDAQITKDDKTATRASAPVPVIDEDDSAAATTSAPPKSAIRRKAVPVDLQDATYWRHVVDRQPQVGRKMAYLLSTGNLISSSGLDMMQVSGYTVVCDKLNFFRFTTHFRSVHRGQFFTEMKTTTVRKLLPESWGFLCPVHTPDGGPCGLLNHIAAPASVTSVPILESSFQSASRLAGFATARGEGILRDENEDEDSAAAALNPPPAGSLRASLASLLAALGMDTLVASGSILPADEMPIMIDGRVVGSARPHVAARIARALRTAKALAGGVRAGVERMGAGVREGQGNAIADLVRAAVRGRCIRTSKSSSASSSSSSSSSLAVGGGGGDDSEMISDDTSSSSSLPTGLPSLGALGVVPPSLEVALIPPPWWDSAVDPFIDADSQNASARVASARGGAGASVVGLFPGLFLSTAAARPVRPVLQLWSGLIELLSPLEQLYLDIACTPEDARDVLANSTAVYSHAELAPTAMLSEIAQLTPFSDQNQSPRNMYQCQMAKQTMGTPAHSLGHRADSKLYRLLNPQVPLVQNAMQSELALDEYPNGANACVAVIASTGFDMEDACIINKSAFERGFGWAAVYKTIQVDLNERAAAGDAGRFSFHNEFQAGEERSASTRADDARNGDQRVALSRPVAGEPVEPELDTDGLPHVGSRLDAGSPLYCVLDRITGQHKVERHKGAEHAFVDEVRLLPSSRSGESKGGVQRASIKIRFDRRPVVGDKFSSRHGQKGVLSYLWPSENMPFTDRGMTPDVLINPHAFPSRMTIGMLVESMAGKSGALRGEFQEGTPFRFNEEHRAVDAFGAQLAAAGYSYAGTETMYSGVTGEALGVDIFYGVVYYQRLRHMVKDKAQVRSTGPTNALTRQPVKGRKKGGGIRFGEMERDALLAHGGAWLLHDRLHSSSDRHTALICRGCGSLLAPFSVPSASSTAGGGGGGGGGGGSGDIISNNSGAAVSTTTTTVPTTNPIVSGGRRRTPHCSACGKGDDVVAVYMPYVFRFLTNELAAMGVKIVLEVAGN